MKFKNHVIVLFIVISFSVMAGCFDSGGSDGSDDGGQTEVEHTETYTVADGQTVSENDIVRLVNGEIETAKMNTEIDEIGDSVEFADNDFTAIISICSLTSNKAIVCYREGNGANVARAYACVLKIDGMSITAGEPVLFNNYCINYLSVSALSPNKAIVVFQNYGNTVPILGDGVACVLEIDGMSITAGDVRIFDTCDIAACHLSVCTLSPNKAIVTYQNGSNSANKRGTACILNISGNVVTPQNPVEFYTGNMIFTSVCALSSNQALVVYQDYDESPRCGTVCLLSIDENIITPSSPIVFESLYTDDFSIAALSSNKAIVAYRSMDSTNTYKNAACILKVNDDQITSNESVTFNNSNLYSKSICTFSSDRAVVVYKDQPGRSVVQTLNIADTDIIYGDPVVFTEDNTQFQCVTALSNSKLVAAYRDGSINPIYRGNACVISVPEEFGNICGIARESGSDGDLCEVADFSQSTHIYNLTGLIKDETYYLNAIGALTIEPRQVPPQNANQIITSVENYIIGVAEDESTLEVIGEYSN